MTKPSWCGQSSGRRPFLRPSSRGPGLSALAGAFHFSPWREPSTSALADPLCLTAFFGVADEPALRSTADLFSASVVAESFASGPLWMTPFAAARASDAEPRSRSPEALHRWLAAGEGGMPHA